MVALQKIYLISWITCLLALAIWSVFRKPAKFMAPIGFLGLGAWLLTLFLMPFGWEAKLLWLCRDAFIAALILGISNTLKANKIVGIAYLVGLSFFGKWVWDHQSLFFKPPSEKIAVAEQAELLIIPKASASEFSEAWLQESLDVPLELNNCFDIRSSNAHLLDDIFCLNILSSNPGELAKAIRKLNTLSDLLYWEENEVISVDEPVQKSNNNTVQSKGGAFNDPQRQDQWGLTAIEAEAMAERLNGLEPKKKSWLVILDTGIETSHEDLMANYKSMGKKNEQDKSGHGTHVAGIAAATTNNNLGGSSLAITDDLIQYSVINVLPNNGFGSQKTIVDGMIKAADAGADVISMSLGGFSNSKRKKVYDEAVRYCNSKGAIVVVAAGNSSRSATDFAPANSEGVIAVSAFDESGNRASFSNTTDGLKMAVAAPGTNIHSTYIKNSYKALNGTSMATPFVSATIAVLKAYAPNLTTEEAFELLNGQSADDKRKLNSADAVDRLIKKSSSF